MYSLSSRSATSAACRAIAATRPAAARASSTSCFIRSRSWPCPEWGEGPAAGKRRRETYVRHGFLVVVLSCLFSKKKKNREAKNIFWLSRYDVTAEFQFGLIILCWSSP
jgi:hypothetical protein